MRVILLSGMGAIRVLFISDSFNGIIRIWCGNNSMICQNHRRTRMIRYKIEHGRECNPAEKEEGKG